MKFQEAISLIRDVEDFPKPGVTFKDISPLFENHAAFEAILDKLSEEALKNFDFNKLVCVESRGFLLGSALSLKMKVPFSLVRKPGKLPGETFSQSYDLEYGSDSLELLKSSLQPTDKVLIIDDILATGGTAHAVEKLCEHAGAQVAGTLCLIELSFLKGTKKLANSFYAPLVL